MPSETSTVPEEASQSQQQGNESRRPDGVSKIDLRDVWGGRTPAASPEATTGKHQCRRSLVVLNGALQFLRVALWPGLAMLA